MKIRIAASLLAVAFSTNVMANDISIEFTWDGSATCKTVYLNPRMIIRNFPPQATRVLITLTEGNREKGGQEVDMPSSGIIPAGVISTIGICNPGIYRWTAIFKSASGAVVAEAHVDRRFPE
jgi:hypothetical protein